MTFQAKETLVIEKDPVFVPVESWLAQAQVNKMMFMSHGNAITNGHSTSLFHY